MNKEKDDKEKMSLTLNFDYANIRECRSAEAAKIMFYLKGGNQAQEELLHKMRLFSQDLKDKESASKSHSNDGPANWG